MKNLRTLVLLLSIISMLWVTACGDDDDDDAEPPSDLVGTWVYSNVTYDFLVNGQDFVQFIVDQAGLSEQDAQGIELLFEQEIENESSEFSFEGVTFTFNSDGTYTVQDPQEGTENGTYTVNSNETQITLSSDGDSFTAEILELNTSTLTLEITDEDTSDDIDGDGTNDTVTVSILLELTK